MAKREVLSGKANVRTEQEAYEADKQLDHPCRLGRILAMTTNRKSLYNQRYGVFARDKRCLSRSGARSGLVALEAIAECEERVDRVAHHVAVVFLLVLR